ncbi:MFS general substrate transporter [Stipitochalara longipes BDJ]|nr:MFS general substrate transporter [Stipitochalara longipes BDJ]
MYRSTCQGRKGSTPLPHRIDGGLRAWLVVLGSWLLLQNTWGLTASFGEFQTYYTHILLPNSTPSAISWIGSIQAFLTMFTGAFSGWMLDSGYLHLILFTGLFLEVFGMAMTSLSTKYWQLLLAQGVCMGLGSGLLLLVSLAVLPMYFKTRRMIAAGIAATGSSIAGIIYPIMLRQLFQQVGFEWAVRIYAIIIFGTVGSACVLIQPQRSSNKAAPLHAQLRYFKDPIYITFVLAYTFFIAAVYIPYFYVESYSLSLGGDPSTTSYLLSFMNAASILGRILPSLLSLRVGALNVIISHALVSTITLYFFRITAELSGIIIVSIVYCAVSGVLFLPPIIVANLTADPTQYGTRIGMASAVAAFGVLAGNPIAGLMGSSVPLVGESVSQVQKGFQGVWFMAGTTMAISVVLMICTRFLLVGRKLLAVI